MLLRYRYQTQDLVFGNTRTAAYEHQRIAVLGNGRWEIGVNRFGCGRIDLALLEHYFQDVFGGRHDCIIVS